MPEIIFGIEARKAAATVGLVFDILHDLRVSGLGARINRDRLS